MGTISSSFFNFLVEKTLFSIFFPPVPEETGFFRKKPNPETKDYSGLINSQLFKMPDILTKWQGWVRIRIFICKYIYSIFECERFQNVVFVFEIFLEAVFVFEKHVFGSNPRQADNVSRVGFLPEETSFLILGRME